MSIKRWGTGMVLMAFLAGALAVGAVAISSASFKDSSVQCGAPLGAALHGKSAWMLASNDPNGAVQALTERQAPEARRASGLFGIRGNRLLDGSGMFVVCRQPARGRLLVSFVCLAAAILGVVFVARRSNSPTPTREERVPVPA